MVVAVIQFNFLFCVGMLISLIADNRLWSALFPSVSLTQNIHLYVVIRQNCGCHLHMYAGVYWRDFSCWLFLWSRASESPAIGFEVLYSFLFHWLKTSLVHRHSAELSTVELRTYVCTLKCTGQTGLFFLVDFSCGAVLIRDRFDLRHVYTVSLNSLRYVTCWECV